MSAIKKSDVRVKKIKTSKVYISAASKNDKSLGNRATNLATIAAAAYEVLKNTGLLVLPDDVTIRIAHTKKATNHGAFYSKEKVVVVDPRFAYKTMMQTICHELVHAEQYYEGRLAWDYDKGVQMWNDAPVYNKGTTYKRYREMPWEVEAFSRQEKLAEQVWMALIELGIIPLSWYRTNVLLQK